MSLYRITHRCHVNLILLRNFVHFTTSFSISPKYLLYIKITRRNFFVGYLSFFFDLTDRAL